MLFSIDLASFLFAAIDFNLWVWYNFIIESER